MLNSIKGKILLFFIVFSIFSVSFSILYKHLIEEKPRSLAESFSKNNKVSISIQNLTDQKRTIGHNILLYPDSVINILKDNEFVFIKNEGNYKFSENINPFFIKQIEKSNEYFKLGNVNNNFGDFFNNNIILSLSDCKRDLIRFNDFNKKNYDLSININFFDINEEITFLHDFDTGVLNVVSTIDNNKKYYNCLTYPLSYKSVYYLIDSILLPEGTKLKM